MICNISLLVCNKKFPSWYSSLMKEEQNSEKIPCKYCSVVRRKLEFLMWQEFSKDITAGYREVHAFDYYKEEGMKYFLSRCFYRILQNNFSVLPCDLSFQLMDEDIKVFEESIDDPFYKIESYYNYRLRKHVSKVQKKLSKDEDE